MRYWKLDGEGGLILAFPAPTHPVSINKANTLHWAARARLLDPWQSIATVVTRQALGANFWPPVAVTIQAELPFRGNQKRDPHNYTGTVVKAIVDGIKKAGLIPDDTPEWATVLDSTLSIQKDKSRPLQARVHIRPRSTT